MGVYPKCLKCEQVIPVHEGGQKSVQKLQANIKTLLSHSTKSLKNLYIHPLVFLY